MGERNGIENIATSLYPSRKRLLAAFRNKRERKLYAFKHPG